MAWWKLSQMVGRNVSVLVVLSFVVIKMISRWLQNQGGITWVSHCTSDLTALRHISRLRLHNLVISWNIVQFLPRTATYICVYYGMRLTMKSIGNWIWVLLRTCIHSIVLLYCVDPAHLAGWTVHSWGIHLIATGQYLAQVNNWSLEELYLDVRCPHPRHFWNLSVRPFASFSSRISTAFLTPLIYVHWQTTIPRLE